ncbi:hypothetical protein RhiirA5_436016 [Rhizophagus irregularis]|uniref:Uncharacterized protein n=1 Tax=Rhizophagus irregularis TaxID=588596 RepID=A0A2N0NMJ1_9GLOM|nr:hypothetical protein RhiirA5_436016 [Rhizophagus irregularis]
MSCRIIAGVESSTAKHIPIVDKVNQPSPSLVLINNPTDTTPLVTTVTTPATPLTTSDNMELPKLDGPSTLWSQYMTKSLSTYLLLTSLTFNGFEVIKQTAQTKGRIPLIPGSKRYLAELRRRKKCHDGEVKQNNIRLARQHQAKWLSTSLNKSEEHQGLTDDLTKFHDIYHTRMTSFTNKRKKIKDPAKLAKLESAYEEFVSEFSFLTFINPILPQYRYKGDTSDDTKSIESRSNKRDVSTMAS